MLARRRPAVKPERGADARDDRRLLHDVRRAVPVWRRLDAKPPTRARSPSSCCRTKMNDKLFGGENSVGRTIRWNDASSASSACSMTGCRCPTFYDLNNGALEEPEDVYIPFGWSVALELDSAGNTQLLEAGGHRDLPGIPGLRVRLDPDVGRAAGRGGTRAHAVVPRQLRHGQKQAGRFQRPLNNRLTNVDQWLDRQRSRRERQPRARRARVRFPRASASSIPSACCSRNS